MLGFLFGFVFSWSQQVVKDIKAECRVCRVKGQFKSG